MRGSPRGLRQHKPATKPRSHQYLNSPLRREQLLPEQLAQAFATLGATGDREIG
jgi:hypothetical protein